MKQDGRGPKAHTKAAQAQDSLRDRKSTTGVSGLPKKGGHGGKFTWSGDFNHDVSTAVSVLDSKDPNFEDPADLTP